MLELFRIHVHGRCMAFTLRSGTAPPGQDAHVYPALVCTRDAPPRVHRARRMASRRRHAVILCSASGMCRPLACSGIGRKRSFLFSGMLFTFLSPILSITCWQTDIDTEQQSQGSASNRARRHRWSDASARQDAAEAHASKDAVGRIALGEWHPVAILHQAVVHFAARICAPMGRGQCLCRSGS